MAAEKITACIACSEQYQTKIMAKALAIMYNVQNITTVNNGRDLIQFLATCKKLPQVIFISMKMTCGDALLTTTICKTLYTKTKIIGVAAETTEDVMQVFLAEGGDAFISENTFEQYINIPIRSFIGFESFEQIIHKIVYEHNRFIDPYFRILPLEVDMVNTTKKIINKHFTHYSQQQILILQLNVLGIIQENMEHIVNMSVASIKRKFKKLEEDFGAENPRDLANTCISYGIVKLITYYNKKDVG